MPRSASRQRSRSVDAATRRNNTQQWSLLLFDQDECWLAQTGKRGGLRASFKGGDRVLLRYEV